MPKIKKLITKKSDSYLENVPYAIYVRKSTDENSGRQVQSIPDQIKACMDFKKRHSLTIMKAPENFDEVFMSKQQKINEGKTKEHKEIFDSIDGLFVVRESESAKYPGIRPKFNALMRMVSEGKVRGVLSYSPDRQARNMVDGGKIIDFVDKGKVDLKYTNFHFEPTAAGKMMLGMWFVMSKQFTDKLSEDTKRGINSKVKMGHAMGVYKHGYIIDPETKKHKPHPEFFDTWKEAFRRKIYEQQTDVAIIDWIMSQGYEKHIYTKKKELKKLPAKIRNMREIWLDPFYYGMFLYAERSIDLRDVSDSYVPLISSDEYQYLSSLLQDKKSWKGGKKTKDENADLVPLPKGFVIAENEEVLTFYPSNKHRIKKRLEKHIQEHGEGTLADMIRPTEIRYAYKIKGKKLLDVNGKNLDISFLPIDMLIEDMLEKLIQTEEKYQKFIVSYHKAHEKSIKQKNNRKKKVRLEISKHEELLKHIIINTNKREISNYEEKVLRAEMRKTQATIEDLKAELKTLETDDLHDMVSFEKFISLLKNASAAYAQAPNVRKRKIVDILFSNIIVSADYSLQLKPKLGLEGLLSDRLSPLRLERRSTP